MDDKSVTIKLEDTTLSSKNFSSNLKPFEFATVETKVKIEPGSEEPEIYTSVSSLRTAEDENREIKSESIDSPTKYLALSAESILPDTSSDFMDSNVTIKKEEDSEICIEEGEEFTELDFNSSVSFNNEENCRQVNEAHSMVKTNQGAKEIGVQTPSFSTKNQTVKVEASGRLKALQPRSSESSFQCPECESRHQTRKRLKIHLRSCHGKRFLCLLCPTAFSKSEEWKLHTATHFNEKIFVCAQCEATFTDREQLTQHRLGHRSERKFSCRYCLAPFSESQELDAHLAIHSSEKPFSCEQCSATFKYRYKFKQHLISHSRKKLFSCPHCAATFTTSTNLQSHMTSHANRFEGEPYLPGLCTDGFQSEVLSKQHSNDGNELRENESRSRVPSVAPSAEASECQSGDVQAATPVPHKNSFPCSDCGSQYFSRSTFQRHLTLRHGKQLLCLHCPTAFCDSKDLRLHLASHSGEKQVREALEDEEHPTQCSASLSGKRPSTGGQEFETSSTPSAEKLFKCAACPVTFKRSSHLKRHAVIHSTRRSLSCAECSAVFYENHRLQKHMQVHRQQQATP